MFPVGKIPIPITDPQKAIFETVLWIMQPNEKSEMFIAEWKIIEEYLEIHPTYFLTFEESVFFKKFPGRTRQ